MRFAFLITVLALVGCGTGGNPKVAKVKGTVSLDGSPLESGKIVFDGGAGIPAAELEVKNGTFAGDVLPGKKTVRISAFKYGPAPKGMEKMPGYEKGVEENFIPARYNSASSDTKEVKEGTVNEFTFEVKSK